MIEPRFVAHQARGDLAQAGRSAQLRVQQRNEVALARQTPHARPGAVTLHTCFERTPRNELQNVAQNAIFAPHGGDPFCIEFAGKLLDSQKNQHHALCPPKPNRTVVHLLPGPSAQQMPALAEGWVPVTSTGMTVQTEFAVEAPTTPGRQI